MYAGLISQLEAIGGMEEWVLYVAQHLPDGPAPDWQGLRDQLVRPSSHLCAERVMIHGSTWCVMRVSDAPRLK